ncbi:hypothetical protein Tco_1383044, partial [Tanacetum coccineum]
KTYHDIATGKVQPKPKYVRRSSRTKSDEAPKPSSSKRVKATAKVEKYGKKKQPALGLETLSDIALTEAEQMKLAIERSKHNFTSLNPVVLVEDEDDNEENVSEHEDDDDDERTESDNDGDDFGDMINEEEKHEEVEANMLYRDVNVNLEGRDTVMTDAPLPNLQATQETEDTHVILTTLINPEVQAKNQFAKIVSSIPGIVDAYLVNKMNEFFKIAVQLQSDRLRDEAQAENEDFLNKLDDNIKKIIKDQVKQQVKAQITKILPRIEKTVNEQLKAKVMTRSSTESKTSHAMVVNLSDLEYKKILIDKINSNKLIHKSDEQKNLYKALVEAYESDRLILDTYGDTVSFKRRRDNKDKDEEPSTGSNRGSKRRRARKEPESTSAPKENKSKTTGKSTDGSKSQHKFAGESAHTEEPMHTDKDLEEPAHQEFETGVTKEQSNEETSQHPDWFQKPAKPPTPDRDWNKIVPVVYRPVQP